MARGREFLDYFEERRSRRLLDRPVGPSVMCGGGTDGPFTVACNLRGTTELCLDLYEDPVFARDLLDFITEATHRAHTHGGQAHRYRLSAAHSGFADDSIQLLSVDQYREWVLPLHQRLLAEFSSGRPNSIHLCGNVRRHLPVVQRELNVQSFDLGFPVDLGEVRHDLGPGATLHGNLHPRILSEGPVSLIRTETAAYHE